MNRYENPSHALNMEENDDGEYILAEPVLTMLNDLFDAHDKEGCGFYASEPWCTHYDELRRMMGRGDKFNHD